jgi:hypothetical protein
MEQRQLRLGDILDDYCPRERRVTNHAVVAMVGPDVKLTRCATCDAEHEYKHAKVPRQRRRDGAPPTLYAQVLAGAPKRVGRGAIPEEPPAEPTDLREVPVATVSAAEDVPAAIESEPLHDEDRREPTGGTEEGPVHRPLIRATLPRVEGQPPPTRPAPEFTIRQPGGRQNRFRHVRRGAQSFHSPSGSFDGHAPRGGAKRQGGGRPPVAVGSGNRQRPPGRKRSR